MAIKKVALYNLVAGMVLDRSVFATMSIDDMALTLEEIRSHPKKSLLIIENAGGFFTIKNMISLIREGDEDYKVIAEKNGVEIRDEDAQAILNIESIISRIKPKAPSYPFHKIPNGWSIDDYLDIRNIRVRRKRESPEGDGCLYSLTVKTLERIWLSASERWTGNNSISRFVTDIRSSGHWETAEISTDYIVCGCQTIRRYELEQLALHFQWKFPAQEAE